MAIGLDGHSRVTGSGSGPHTLNHSCGGVQRLLIVIFSGMRGALGSWTTSVTYNGVAMTLGAGNEASGSSRNVRTEVWYMVNPPGGSAYPVAVSTSASMMGFSLAAISLTGVDQSSPVGNTGVDTGNKGSFAVGLTTTVANVWLIGGGGIRNGTLTWAEQGSAVEVYDQSSGSSPTNDVAGCGDYLVCTSAGSYSLAANASNSNFGVLAALVVQPATAAPVAWLGAELLLPASAGIWAF